MNDDVAALVAGASPDPLLLIDDGVRLLWANAAAEQRFGWSAADFGDRPLSDLVHPDDIPTALASLESVQGKQIGTVVELRILDRSGSYSRFEVRGAGVALPSGDRAIVLSLRESTDRRRWEIAGGDAALLGGILDATPAITALLDADGRVRGANRGVTRLLGRPLEETVGSPFVDLVAAEDRPAVAAELALAATSPGTRGFEARLATRHGDEIPFALTVVNLLGDRAVAGLVVSGADVSALVEARERLEHLATHDDLTGLPNRAALRERLHELVAAGDAGHTVVFCDLDELKSINDRFGHTGGDVVLRATAERLRGVVRDGDVVARLSGDEFVIIAGSTDADLVEDLAGRIADAMAEPIELPDGTRLCASITVGGAPLRGDVDRALAAADAAMYAAKRQKHGAA